MQIFKGLKNVILNRTMTDFFLRSYVAKRLYLWSRDMLIPDESFYSTLIRVSVDQR